MLYGFQAHIWEIWLQNISGVLAYPLYISLYISFEPRLSLSIKILLISILFILINLVSTLCYIYFPDTLNELIAFVLYITVQLSQLVTISQVCIYNNSIYVDVWVLSSFLLYTFLNLTMSFLNRSWSYLIVNVIALVLISCQFYCYFWYELDESTILYNLEKAENTNGENIEYKSTDVNENETASKKQAEEIVENEEISRNNENNENKDNGENEVNFRIEVNAQVSKNKLNKGDILIIGP